MRYPLLAAAALAPVLAFTGMAQADESLRRIIVTGEAQVQAVPDMATLTLGVTQQASDAGQAMQGTSEAVAQMLDRLTALGVADRDLQTRQVTLNPVWTTQDDNGVRTRTITGFEASNTVFVRVRDLDNLGTVMTAVLQDGANEFNGLRFSVQDPEPLMAQARAQAVEQAMAEAQQLAEAAGVSLGAVMRIDDQGGGRPPMPMAEMARLSRDAVPIATGEVSISTSVTMVFAIGG